MRVTAALALLQLAGCDAVFSIERSDGGAPTSDAPDGPACTPWPIATNFDGNQPCAPWGSGTPTNVDVVQAGGLLQITTHASEQGYAGCTAASVAPFTEFGAFIRLDAIGEQSNMYVQFSAYAAEPPNTSGARFLYQDGRLELHQQTEGLPDVSLGSVSFDLPTMRWWRFRPLPARGMLVGEVSPDGATWTQVGSPIVGSIATSVKLDLGAGTYNNQSNAQTTTSFDLLNVCP